MGFTAEQATSALQAANGDLDLAVELLLQQSEAEPVPKGEGKGTGKGKPAAPPDAVTSHLEIDIDGGWKAFEHSRDALEAKARGEREFRYSARGQMYKVTFEPLQQVNLATDRVRKLRFGGDVSPSVGGGGTQPPAGAASPAERYAVAARAGRDLLRVAVSVETSNFLAEYRQPSSKPRFGWNCGTTAAANNLSEDGQ